jgi:hypothetical protein
MGVKLPFAAGIHALVSQLEGDRLAAATALR